MDVFQANCEIGFFPPTSPQTGNWLLGKPPTDQALSPVGWERPSLGHSVDWRMTVHSVWAEGGGGSPREGKDPACWRPVSSIHAEGDNLV